MRYTVAYFVYLPVRLEVHSSPMMQSYFLASKGNILSIFILELAIMEPDIQYSLQNTNAIGK